MKNKVIIALTLAAIILSADPSYAASGGRISSGGFRSSPSSGGSSRSGGGSLGGGYSGGYSRPYTAPSVPRSRTYTPAPTYVEPSRPRTYTPAPVYVEPSRPSTNIIVLPDLTPPAPPVVVTPSAPATPTPPAVSAPAATPKPSPVTAETPSAALSPALILMLLVLGIGVLYVITSNRSDNKGDNDRGYSGYPAGYYGSVKQSKVNVAKVRVALLASARDIQEDLERLAQDGDTESNEGLTTILQETALSLMRHPDLVAYASSDFYSGSESDMESLYGRLTMEERSKITDEALTNIAGKHSSAHLGSISSANEYILVSLLVAYGSGRVIGKVNNVDTLKESLVALGSILPERLMALEIIWQPEGEGEVLSKDELLTLYSDLVPM